MDQYQWEKLGLMFQPGKSNWMHSHAQNPFSEFLGNDMFRIHFSSRDKENRSRGGCFDINMNNPFEILSISENPTIDLGELGAFDDCGAMPGSIVIHQDTRYMYYTGWSKAMTVPFSFHIGLAISQDEGKSYQRYSKAPVLGRNHFDPFISGAPFVIIENGIFKMWYSSCLRWEIDKKTSLPKHYYTIKYAESKDGILWTCSSEQCIPFLGNEYAIARPIVFKQDDIYNMWFTFRGDESYRIGLATSLNGKDWIRNVPLQLNISDSGWDSEMICYANPIFFKDKIYILYNGNNYGEDGIGIAVMI